MSQKTSFTTGVKADGSVVPLYVGTDTGEAKAVYTRAINGEFPGIVAVRFFDKPQPDRRGDVDKAAVAEAKAKAEDPIADALNAAAEEPAAEPEAPAAKPKKAKK